jgi:cytochrome c biogenesis protein CcmG/thiol:disulfide interchange protein DsbE
VQVAGHGSLRSADASRAGHARFGYVSIWASIKNSGLPHLAGRPRGIVLAAVALAGLALIGVLTVGATGRSQAGPRPLLPAKPFSLQELGHSGSHVSLAAFAGQPVILNFFASWCVPCKRETPLLAGFYAQHHGKVAVIGVAANDPLANALKFVRKEGVGYPVGLDPFPAKTALSYGVQALPQTFFLNARHQIVRRVFGDVTGRELNAWSVTATQASVSDRS